MAGEPKNQLPFTRPVDTSGVGTAATKTLAAQGPGVTTVRSADELNNIATSEVNADIGGQVAPLQSQYDTLTGSEERARQNITTLFGTLQPSVEASAAAVKGSYDEAQGHQEAIFSKAMQKLNQLKQSRAQEAQALAQEMGGPVALSEFTAGMDDAQGQLANLGAGQMLHTLGYAQAGEQEAQAWAGKVMPLVQTEQQATVRQYFEDQKKTIQGQITALKATAGDKINTRKNELLLAERTYALQKTQQALDKIKNDHDWQATKRTLKNDDARLKIAQQAADDARAGVTGELNGKPTLAARDLTAKNAQIAAQLGLSTQEYLLRKKQFQTNSGIAKEQLQVAKNQTAAQWLDAGLNPQPGKSVTTTQAVETDAASAFKNPGKSFKQNGKWYKYITTTYTPQNAQITEPNALVDYMVAHGINKVLAVRLVKARLQISDWKYGQRDPHAGPEKYGPPVPPGQ